MFFAVAPGLPFRDLEEGLLHHPDWKIVLPNGSDTYVMTYPRSDGTSGFPELREEILNEHVVSNIHEGERERAFSFAFTGFTFKVLFQLFRFSRQPLEGTHTAARTYYNMHSTPEATRAWISSSLAPRGAFSTRSC